MAGVLHCVLGQDTLLSSGGNGEINVGVNHAMD